MLSAHCESTNSFIGRVIPNDTSSNITTSKPILAELVAATISLSAVDVDVTF
jgi:hypothetical protein